MSKKKIILIIATVLNIILAVVLVLTALAAADELKFTYVEEDTIAPDVISSNLERENYGVAAAFSHPIRGGAVVADKYKDLYTMGEYADLKFIKEIFVAADNTQMTDYCDKRLKEIRNEMSDHESDLDKIDWSVQHALLEKTDD